MPPFLHPVRNWLRRQHAWVKFRDLNREGWRNVAQRRWYQRQILDTPPIRTAREGPAEVHTLTWHRDWINVVWALKSYYHFAGVDYPLVIHDGGLRPGQERDLLAHFPDATLISQAEADRRVAELLQERGLERCLAYRARSGCAQQFLDFLLLADAEYLVCFDSDVVFFDRPELLMVSPEGLSANRYNRDQTIYYSATPEELEASFGIRPVPLVNAGVMMLRRSSFDFDAIERWLQHPALFDEGWLTSQTIHALSSTVAGIELLPESYFLATRAGIPVGAACKHYPGYFRHLLYTEGMNRLIRSGFLENLRSGPSRNGTQRN